MIRSGNKHRRVLSAIMLTSLLLSAPAIGQDETDDGAGEVRNRAAIDLSLTGVAASGASIDANEDEDRSGGIAEIGLDWDRDSGANHFDLDARSSYYKYTDADRDDRWSNALSLAYSRDLSDTIRVGVRARGATRLSTLESREADEARLQGRIEFNDRTHRIRLTSGWRWRNYQDRDTGTGDGAMADLDYRYRISRGNFIFAEATYDEITSDIPRLTYERVTLRGAGRMRINEDLDLELGLKWRDWKNENRFIGSERRTASSIAPELRLGYEFGDDWSLNAEGTVIWRESNDPGYERTVYRAFLTLEKRFWIDR
ncbi:TonB-dependent receptor [Aurantiacibacter hainanensis]|uniref:TonB-dependent receptor n=1 Tax=Aurantiacibacter hainanensis TaxID=3076114 RepID=UPI0030C70567